MAPPGGPAMIGARSDHGHRHPTRRALGPRRDRAAGRRGAGPAQGLRRAGRARRRVPGRPPGRDRRHHRTQRLGQDDPGGVHPRSAAGRRRPGAGAGARSAGRPRPPARARRLPAPGVGAARPAARRGGARAVRVPRRRARRPAGAARRVGAHRAPAHAVRRAVRRPAPAPAGGPGPGHASARGLPGRDDHRARPIGPPHRLGPHRRHPPSRHDRGGGGRRAS